MGDSSDYSGNGGNMKAVMITGKIMVLAIFVLFVVVVAVLLLHLYARWFWWRIVEEEPLHDRRSGRRRRRFVFEQGQDPAPATPRRGLDLAVLRSIPVVVYRLEDFKEGLDCAVCLCDVAKDERMRILPECSHGFHVECIDMWFQSHSTCPLCRSPVRMVYGGSSKVDDRESNRVESSSVRDELSERRTNAEASYFPVNMLIWGDEACISSTNGTLDRGNRDKPPCFFGESSLSMDGNRPEKNRALVIEIPRQTSEDTGTPLTSIGPPDNMKSPVSGRLRSFGRLLSRERKVSPCSPNSLATTDNEQGGRDATQSC